jgi:hypothetical protein
LSSVVGMSSTMRMRIMFSSSLGHWDARDRRCRGR